MPPRRSTRAAASDAAPAASTSAPARASRSRKTVAPPSPIASEHEHESADELEGGDEEAVDVKPTRRAVKAATKSAPAPAKGRRSTRTSAVQPAEQEADEAEEEEEEQEVVRPRARGGRGKKKAAVSDEEQDDDEAGQVPDAIAKKPGRQGRKVSQPTPAPAVHQDEEESENETVATEDYKTAKIEQTPDTVFDSAVSHTPSDDTATDQIPIAVPLNIGSGDSEEDEGEGDETVRLDAPPTLSTPSPSTPMTARKPAVSASASTPAPFTSSTQPPPVAEPEAPKGPIPRLTIHKLVLVNFKSYAGRQEIGPFHKSFSAIVGPNGSGKSNTIDALLFVFGYRASKMRQGKLSELIHNSAGKEGLENCSVEVWFREIVDLPGKDNFLLVPNSQLIVSRTAYRNNSSKYSINDRTSSFGEVTTLLKGKGIDLDHNRFLILQGEVESIALMKPKAQTEHEDGLLEYLEDIIGTTKYKEPIEQADKEREELDEQRGEKMNRLKVVEREKGALEEKKREAEDFLRDSNELTRKKSLLWQFHMRTLANNLEITSKAIETLTAKLAEEQEANSHHLAEIESLQKEYDEKLATFEEVKKFADQLVKDSKKFEKEEVGLSEKKKHLGTKAKKFKKSITEDGHARSEAMASIENYGGELETNRKKVNELEKKLVTEEAELEEVRDSLKDKTDVFTNQIETKQRELEPWTAKISEKQSAIDIAKSERDALVQKASGAQTALEEAEAFVQQVKEADGSKNEEYGALKKEKKMVEREMQDAEARVKDVTAKAEQLRGKVSTSRGKADEAKASLAADKSENAVLASLNKLKTQGRIKGFHGRLGDLGVIDDKYDVAVTTACSALNNLVVDTVEQGQACIEHLRKGNVGRASFMVLEKLPPRDMSRIETPENVPRLFDLIKPKDPRFAPAFYKGLFNTLVADDLAQAQRIGYGKRRWRVVTLAGQLIDPSGTMSGGGNRVARGGMSSKFAADKVAPEVVARYEQELGQAEQELMRALAERKEAEVELGKLKKRLPEIEMQMDKLDMEVKTGEKRIAEAERRLQEVKAQSKPDPADERRVKALNAEIETLTKAVDKLKSESSSISDEIKSLQQKILDVGGVKLRAIQSKVVTSKGLLDLANDAITKAEVGQAKAERDAQKLSKTIESNTAKLAEVEEELAVVQSDLDAVSGDLVAIREKVQEAVDACADVQETLGESKKELDGKSSDINAFRKKEMELKQKIEDNGKTQKDNKRQMEHWRKRHDELELAYVDDDEEEDEEEEEPSRAGTPNEGDEEQEGGASGAKRSNKKRKADALELVEYSADELRSVDKDLLNAEITQLEEDIGRAKPNLSVLNEYRKREAEYLERASDMESVTAARDAAKQRYDELRNVRLKEFMAGFHAISAKLKEMYQMITMGGNAEIELIDSMDPFSEGVVLSIMPPKKSWRAIANLSGGEKTLASLALVFALHVFKPTPLYFMDEIDAALDFKNVSIVANYIQTKTQAAQFIVISLRNDMFELAHRLVGIYKTSNCTKSIAIDNKDLKTQAVPPAVAAAAAARRAMGMRPSTARPGVLPTPGGPTRLVGGSASGNVGLASPSPSPSRMSGLETPTQKKRLEAGDERAGSVVPPTPSTVRG